MTAQPPQSELPRFGYGISFEARRTGINRDYSRQGDPFSNPPGKPLWQIAADEARAARPGSFEISSRVAAYLNEAGLEPDRRSYTADGSVLFQFLTGRQACVDVYPTGEIVVILRVGDVDHVYELRANDLNDVVELLKDGRGTV